MLELLELSLAHVRAPVRASALLDQLRNGLDACCAGELAQLGELVGFVASRPQDCDGEPALGLRTGRRIRLAVCHETDYGLDGPPQASVLPCASPPSWPRRPRTPSCATSRRSARRRRQASRSSTSDRAIRASPRIRSSGKLWSMRWKSEWGIRRPKGSRSCARRSPRGSPAASTSRSTLTER